MKPELEGYEKGQETELGAVNMAEVVSHRPSPKGGISSSLRY